MAKKSISDILKYALTTAIESDQSLLALAETEGNLGHKFQVSEMYPKCDG